MNRPLFAWLTAAICVLSCRNPVAAAVFERDWKTPGDGLLTYDDVNQREWLDLPVSLLSQFPGATHQEKLDNALAELQPGGLFDGFHHATLADVTSLANSAGIDTLSFDFATNHVGASNLIDLLGITLGSVDLGFFSQGFLDEFVTVPPSMSPQRLGIGFQVDPAHRPQNAGMFSSRLIEVLATWNTGLMLYRNVVPEPSSIGLVVTILVVSMFTSRQFRPRP